MQEQLELLIKQVSQLTHEIQSQHKRLEKLEKEHHFTEPTKSQATLPQDHIEPVLVQTVNEQQQVAHKERIPASPTAIPKKSTSFSEENIGLYLSRIGMIGLLLGFGFLLKYSFDNNLIGPAARIAIGYMGGLGLFGVGELYRKKYTAWSRVFTGGAIVLLYFSTFAAQYFFNFFSLPITVLLLSIITLAGFLVSDWYKSPLIFSFAMTGGYLTPLIISGSHTEEAFLRLGYLVLLNIAVVAASHLNKWRIFDVLSFIVTTIYLSILYVYVSVSLAAAFTAIYFITFTISAVSLAFETAPSKNENTLITLTKEMLTVYLIAHAVFLYHFMLLIWGNTNDIPFGIFGIIISFGYMAYAFVVRRIQQVPAYLKYVLGSISIALLLASINTLATDNWKIMLWSVLSAGIVYAGYMQKDVILRNIGAAVYTISAVSIWKILVTSAAVGGGFLNISFISLAISILFLLLAAIMYSRSKDLKEGERFFPITMLIVSNSLLLMHITMELENTIVLNHWLAIAVSILYSIYAFVLLLIGTKLHSTFSRYFGAVLFALMFIFHLSAIQKMNMVAMGIFNMQFILLLLPILLLFLATILYKKSNSTSENERSVIGWMFSGANLLLLSLVTREFNITIENSQTFAVVTSVFYAIYACIAIAIGFLLKKKYARYLGLVLFGITIFKVVLIDMQGLDLIYRVLAFIIVGVVLILGSYLYQRNTFAE